MPRGRIGEQNQGPNNQKADDRDPDRAAETGRRPRPGEQDGSPAKNRISGFSLAPVHLHLNSSVLFVSETRAPFFANVFSPAPAAQG
jgi:hypothetical protein